MIYCPKCGEPIDGDWHFCSAVSNSTMSGRDNINIQLSVDLVKLLDDKWWHELRIKISEMFGKEA